MPLPKMPTKPAALLAPKDYPKADKGKLKPTTQAATRNVVAPNKVQKDTPHVVTKSKSTSTTSSTLLKERKSTATSSPMQETI